MKDIPDYHVGRIAFISFLNSQKDISVQFLPLDAKGDLDFYKKGVKRLVEEEKIDLLFVTGTRSTIPVVDIVKELPVVFCLVATPARSGIVESLEKPGGNITGTHCNVPIIPQLRTIKKVLPHIKNLGVVYTKGESNAEIQLRDYKKYSKEMGINVISSHIPSDCNSDEEVSEASRKLVGKVDLLVGLMDTSISRYGRGMLVVANENKIPSFSPLESLFIQGELLFCLGSDSNMLGKLAGEKALSILVDGVNPGDIPIGTYEQYTLCINLSYAKKIGISIPVSVLKTANRIIK